MHPTAAVRVGTRVDLSALVVSRAVPGVANAYRGMAPRGGVAGRARVSGGVSGDGFGRGMARLMVEARPVRSDLASGDMLDESWGSPSSSSCAATPRQLASRLLGEPKMSYTGELLTSSGYAVPARPSEDESPTWLVCGSARWVNAARHVALWSFRHYSRINHSDSGGNYEAAIF